MTEAERLTKKFFEGKLKNDWYYVKYEIGIDMLYITDDQNNLLYNPRVYGWVQKVLAKVPSYLTYKNMLKKIK